MKHPRLVSSALLLLACSVLLGGCSAERPFGECKSPGREIVVKSDLAISPGESLSFAPGSTVTLLEGAFIRNRGGRLIAIGIPSAPVTFMVGKNSGIVVEGGSVLLREINIAGINSKDWVGDFVSAKNSDVRIEDARVRDIRGNFLLSADHCVSVIANVKMVRCDMGVALSQAGSCIISRVAIRDETFYGTSNLVEADNSLLSECEGTLSGHVSTARDCSFRGPGGIAADLIERCVFDDYYCVFPERETVRIISSTFHCRNGYIDQMMYSSRVSELKGNVFVLYDLGVYMETQRYPNGTADRDFISTNFHPDRFYPKERMKDNLYVFDVDPKAIPIYREILQEHGYDLVPTGDKYMLVLK